MRLNDQIEQKNRKYVLGLLVKNIPAILFVILILVILIAKALYLKPMEVIEQNVVSGILVYSSARESNTGSYPIWRVTLDSRDGDVLVSASERYPFKKGRRVNLIEYVYENGSKKYGFYEFAD